MLKKTITYTDYDGNERKEDFYFNLTAAELAEMESEYTGGMMKVIERIIAAEDRKQIIAIFKDLILRAYGEKTLDGRRFVKNQELRDSFAQTEAYSVLFMEMGNNEEAAIAFINGIVPQQPNISSPAPPTK